MSGLIVAALTIITLLALTGLFEDLPEATLSAIVIAAVIELVDVPALIKLYRAYSRRLGREFGFVARCPTASSCYASRAACTSPTPTPTPWILEAASSDGIRVVVLDAETMPFIDVTAAHMLADLDDDLHQQGVRLLIARNIGQVRDVLHHVIDDAGLEHFYPTVQAAVDAAVMTAQ